MLCGNTPMIQVCLSHGIIQIASADCFHASASHSRKSMPVSVRVFEALFGIRHMTSQPGGLPRSLDRVS